MANTTSSTNNQFAKTGLGGAGNYHSITEALPAYVACEAPRKNSTTSSFTSGIGGAGNIHSIEDQATISSSESLRRERMIRDNSSSCYHCGIGGRGNRVSRDTSPSSGNSSRNSSPPPPPPAYAASQASSHSTMDGFDRLLSSISSKVAARNARVSLFEAWQRKLPAYPGLPQTPSSSNLI